jgi:hypothetical protein
LCKTTFSYFDKITPTKCSNSGATFFVLSPQEPILYYHNENNIKYLLAPPASVVQKAKSFANVPTKYNLTKI